MEWKIIHFLNDNVDEAVPSAWVFDDICYWPPYKGSKLTRAISSCILPIFGEWNICKIRQLANGQTYDNLLEAKAKSAKAEYSSDLNSDLETKRQIKTKRFFDEKSSGDDVAQFDSDSTPRHNISLCTSQKRYKLNNNISEDSSSDYSELDILSNTTMPSSPSKLGIKSLQPTVTNGSVRNGHVRNGHG
ncbi:hypothetical protein CAJAP_01904 [Camponotus japonicus]